MYFGRFLSGFSSGSYSVIIPLYISEISEKEIRGTLGSYFQLQVNAGILYIYTVGSYVCPYLSLIFVCFIKFIIKLLYYFAV